MQFVRMPCLNRRAAGRCGHVDWSGCKPCVNAPLMIDLPDIKHCTLLAFYLDGVACESPITERRHTTAHRFGIDEVPRVHWREPTCI